MWWRCWSRRPSSSPHGCANSQERRSGRAVKACRATACTMPTCPTTPWPWRVSGRGRCRGNLYLHIAEYAGPTTIRQGAAPLRRRAGAAPRGWACLTTCSRRCAAATRGQPVSRLEPALLRHPGARGRLPAGGGPVGLLDTGLFLDHRVTRELVGAKAAGKRFLNLFAYTGSATVHAAGGGAVETTTVDLSQTYLDWARRNMELNGFTGPEHSFVRADAMAFVTETRRRPLRYDLAFVDPPTFSNSKAMGKRTWDVQRDHVELLIGVSRLLSEEGGRVLVQPPFVQA
ncbi:MAG: class I SAM-dependent methyltransferase [Eggerthellaceae bacterium]